MVRTRRLSELRNFDYGAATAKFLTASSLKNSLAAILVLYDERVHVRYKLEAHGCLQFKLRESDYARSGLRSMVWSGLGATGIVPLIGASL